MNAVIMRKVEMTGNFSPLSSNQDEVATVEVSVPPTNSTGVVFEGDDGSEIPWVRGEYHVFHRVNLSSIRVKGVPGDCVTLIGGTW